MQSVMGFTTGQKERGVFALLRRQVETMHGGGGVVDYWIIGLSRLDFYRHVELFRLRINTSLHYSITSSTPFPHWNRFFALSKKFWLIGLSLPLHRSLNSWSLAFCADERWVGTSTLMRTCKSPWP